MTRSNYEWLHQPYFVFNFYQRTNRFSQTECKDRSLFETGKSFFIFFKNFSLLSAELHANSGFQAKNIFTAQTQYLLLPHGRVGYTIPAILYPTCIFS